jgi:hypothetical protein
MKGKGGDKKMESIVVQQKLLKHACPVCGRVIIGSTEKQIMYNLKLHMDSKHPSGKKDA